MSDTELKTVTPDLIIELIFRCPHCDELIDLLEDEHQLNDDGELLNCAIPDNGEYWDDHHEKFKKQLNCPECGEPVLLKGIAW